MEFVKVTENTYYFDEPGLSIPCYKYGNKVILLDSGYVGEGAWIAHFLASHNLTLTAVIHSHCHVDHLNGDLSLLKEMDVPIYGPVRDIRSSFEEYEGQMASAKELDMWKSYARIIGLMSKEMIDIEGKSNLSIDEQEFRFIPCGGHSECHNIIITPDEVCYLGDILMANDTLLRAKLPYSYTLDKDMESKDSLKGLQFNHYIAAHEGEFSSDRFQEVLNKNISIYNNLCKTATEVSNNYSDEDEEEKLERFFDKIRLHRYREEWWVRHTAKEVFRVSKEGGK